MPTDPTIQFGILRCRDLVQLYYGARLVASITENSVGVGNAATQILGQDPRRVRYEIIIANATAAAVAFGLDASQDTLNNVFSQYMVNAGDTLIVERTFLTDLDAVTLPVWCVVAGAGAVTVSTRETFLTPAPVDEGP